MRSLLILIAFACVYSEAQARPRYYSTTPTNNNKVVSYTSEVQSGGSDQERCQAEANYMASRGIKGHVWGCIGRFEGVERCILPPAPAGGRPERPGERLPFA